MAAARRGCYSRRMTNTLKPLLASGLVLAAALLALPAPASACHGACAWKGGEERAASCARFALPPPAFGSWGFSPTVGVIRNPGERTTLGLGVGLSTPALFLPGTKLGAGLRLSGLAATNGSELESVLDARIGWLGWGSAALLVGGGISYGRHDVMVTQGDLAVMQPVRTAAAIVRTGIEVGLFGKMTVSVPVDFYLVPRTGALADAGMIDATAVDWDVKILFSHRFAL